MSTEQGDSGPREPVQPKGGTGFAKMPLTELVRRAGLGGGPAVPPDRPAAPGNPTQFGSFDDEPVAARASEEKPTADLTGGEPGGAKPDNTPDDPDQKARELMWKLNIGPKGTSGVLTGDIPPAKPAAGVPAAAPAGREVLTEEQIIDREKARGELEIYVKRYTRWLRWSGLDASNKVIHVSEDTIKRELAQAREAHLPGVLNNSTEIYYGIRAVIKDAGRLRISLIEIAKAQLRLDNKFKRNQAGLEQTAAEKAAEWSAEFAEYFFQARITPDDRLWEGLRTVLCIEDFSKIRYEFGQQLRAMRQGAFLSDSDNSWYETWETYDPEIAEDPEAVRDTYRQYLQDQAGDLLQDLGEYNRDKAELEQDRLSIYGLAKSQFVGEGDEIDAQKRQQIDERVEEIHRRVADSLYRARVNPDDPLLIEAEQTFSMSDFADIERLLFKLIRRDLRSRKLPEVGLYRREGFEADRFWLKKWSDYLDEHPQLEMEFEHVPLEEIRAPGGMFRKLFRRR